MRYAQHRTYGLKPLRGSGIVVMALALVAGCGGGGGGGGSASLPTFTATPPSTHTVAPPPSPTLPPTAVPTPTNPPQATATSLPSATPPPATATLSFTEVPTEVPTPPPTATPLTGPVVTAFGIADASGSFNRSVGNDAQGRAVFSRSTGDGFIIYIEGRPGPSGLPIGTQLLNTKAGDPTRQPDLQIESSRPLGDGSVAVCDNSFPNVGGVPAIDPTDFGPVQSVSDALNDLACRFTVYIETDFACTQDDSGDFVFGNPSSSAQFCTLVNNTLTFPSGETVLAARLLDTAGNAGPAVEIVVRITGG
jgi:hypothetical protein